LASYYFFTISWHYDRFMKLEHLVFVSLIEITSSIQVESPSSRLLYTTNSSIIRSRMLVFPVIIKSYTIGPMIINLLLDNSFVYSLSWFFIFNLYNHAIGNFRFEVNLDNYSFKTNICVKHSLIIFFCNDRIQET
jgi:hypothetical protein